MKILVTGANSFLGSHVIKILLGQNISVKAMMRPNAAHHLPQHEQLSIFRGHLTSPECLEEAVKDCTHVIHLAADTSQHHLRHRNYLDVNVHASVNLFRAASQAHCLRFVFVSSANTIGYGSFEQPGRETHSPSPLFRRSGYAASKMLAEQLLLQASEDSPTGLLIVNPTFMIGPEDHNPHSGRIFRLILDRSFCFYPGGGKNFIDVRDTAACIVQALSRGKCGEKYLLSGTNMSYRDFFRTVALQNHRRPLLIAIPDFLLTAAGAIGSCIRFLGIRSELSLTNARILTIRNYYSNSKSTRELGLNCRSIEDTLTDYLQWKAKFPIARP